MFSKHQVQNSQRGLKRPSDYDDGTNSDRTNDDSPHTLDEQNTEHKREEAQRRTFYVIKLQHAIANGNFWKSPTEPVSLDFLDFILDIPFGQATSDTQHMPLWSGTREEFHPLLLCPTCDATLYTNVWRNGNGFSWKCKQCRGTNIWDNEAKQVIAKLRYARYMTPELCGFFSPSRVRFYDTLSFPLINHVPTEMVDEDEWLWLVQATDLVTTTHTSAEDKKVLPDHMTGDTNTDTTNSKSMSHCLNTAHVHVSRRHIREWSQFAEPKPTASVVGTLPMSPHTIATIQKWTSQVLSASSDLVLVNEDSVMRPLTSCESTAEDNARMVRLMRAFNPQHSLLLFSGNTHNALFDHFDVKIHCRRSVHFAKVWSPWYLDSNTPLFCLPLHGMGLNDLGWLMSNGIGDWVLLQLGERVVTVCMATLRHAVSTFLMDHQQLPLPEQAQTMLPRDTDGIEANKLRTTGITTDATTTNKNTPSVVFALSDLCGRPRSSAVHQMTQQAPTFTHGVPDTLTITFGDSDVKCEDTKPSTATLEDLRSVCRQTYDATRYADCAKDADRHRLTNTYCGPACNFSGDNLNVMKRTHGCIDGDETLLLPPSTIPESWSHFAHQPLFVSLSDFRASDVYLIMTPSCLATFLQDYGCIVEV